MRSLWKGDAFSFLIVDQQFEMHSAVLYTKAQTPTLEGLLQTTRETVKKKTPNKRKYNYRYKKKRAKQNKISKYWFLSQ